MATAEFNKRQQHIPEGLEDYCSLKTNRSNITIMNRWSAAAARVGDTVYCMANTYKTIFVRLQRAKLDTVIKS